MEIAGHKIIIKKDNTVKRERYYCAVGVLKRKVIYGSTVDVVYNKCLKAYEKGEISFEPYPAKAKLNIADDEPIPFF